MRFWLAMLVTACLVLPGQVEAAGFYVLPRGVRGVAQGGSVVAGGDDPSALWYNPAALIDSRQQALFDLLLPMERFSFTRINSGGEQEATIDANALPLPIPGMAYSHPLGEDLVVAGGLFAPTATMLDYPQGVENPETGEVEYPPQGFSVMGMEGSALVYLQAGLAYRALPGLSLGASLGVMAGSFQAELLTYVADPGSMGPPESEQYVRPASFAMRNVIRPTGSLGVLADLGALFGGGGGDGAWVLGASFALPVSLEGTGRFEIDLPDSGLYADAELSGDEVEVAMAFPWVARVGLRHRVLEELQAELSFTYEAWSMQDAIEVSSDIRITNVPVLDSFTVGDLRMERNLQDTWALGLGAEYALNPELQLRGATWYESSSMSDATMSPLTPDTEKAGLALGAAVSLERWLDGLWLDVAAGYLHMRDRDIPQGTNQVYRLEALRPALSPCEDPEQLGAGCPVPLGDGKYEMGTPFAGLGLRWLLDAPPESGPVPVEDSPMPDWTAGASSP